MNDRTKDYVFVSYSHSDDIQDLLGQFEAHGYNLVYDQVMSYGEEWDLNARRYIQSSKCKGVLSFLSRNSLCSKPVLMETEYAARFEKDIFAILMEHRTLPEIQARLMPTLSESKQYIVESIMENFSSEKLYAFYDAIDWDKVAQTFASWGFYAQKASNYDGIVSVAYSSDIKDEKKRLSRQQESYLELDMQAINSVLDGTQKDAITVLDLGCGNGSVTVSRFADNPRITRVIGVDIHQKSIEEATERAKAYGDKFSFHIVDLNEGDAIEHIRAIMAQVGVDAIDLVFSALTLHHLNNPKLLLLKLYDIFDEHGKIILRGSDDGGKLCYPESALLTEILDRYGRLINNSDRENGRKLYGQLYGAGYENIRMIYTVSDTTDADEEFKNLLFHLAFGFRLNRVDALVDKNPDNQFIKEDRKSVV